MTVEVVENRTTPEVPDEKADAAADQESSNKNRSLDYLAAAASQEITNVIGKTVKNNKKVKPPDVENLTTKTLGIHQEQGIYAMILFLLSRSGNKSASEKMNAEQRVACEITAQLFHLLQEQELKPLGVAYNKDIHFNNVNSEAKGLLNHFVKEDGLLDQIDSLLLVRDLYEQTLIYTRYGAKAAAED
ncbi:MAG: hypothetical protein ACNY01_05545 [Desulfobacteria bacterium]